MLFKKMVFSSVKLKETIHFPFLKVVRFVEFRKLMIRQTDRLESRMSSSAEVILMSSVKYKHESGLCRQLVRLY